MVVLSRRVLAVAAVAAIVLGVAATQTVRGQEGGGARWTKVAPFPEPQEEIYALTLNGKMYAIGGFGKTGDPQGLMYEYDPGADKWTKKKDMPVKVHHQAQTVLNNKIYFFGGCLRQLAGPGATDNSWEYDPGTNEYRALAPMPTKICAANAEAVDGKIYVIGGFTTMENGQGTRVVGLNYMYDPAANRWEAKSPMPTTRNHVFSGAVNGKIYIIGGRQAAPGAAYAPTDVVEEYDTVKNLWSSKAPIPTGRSGGGAATYNGKIYTAGGELTTRAMSLAYRALEAYDPATDTWSILPSMPVAKHGQGVAVVGSKLYVSTGALTPGTGFGPDFAAATGQVDVLDLAGIK